MGLFDVLTRSMEADPSATGYLIDEIVYSMVADEAEERADQIDALLGMHVLERVGVAKRALARTYVDGVSKSGEPDGSAQKIAEWLAGIEQVVAKALSASDLITFNNAHPRDSSGRFVRGVNQDQRSNPMQYSPSQFSRRVAPGVANMIQIDPTTNARSYAPGTDEDQMQRFQSQFEQVNDIMREFERTFGKESEHFVALITTANSRGNIEQHPVVLNEAHTGDWADPGTPGGVKLEDSVISVELLPSPNAPESAVRAAEQYNRMGSMGGSALARLSQVSEQDRMRLLGTADRNYGAEQSGLARFFGRAQAAGPVFEAIGQDKLVHLANFAGTYGPEVERVLGSRAQQAAYRYRGTERQPDLELVSQFTSRDMRVVDGVGRYGLDSDLANAAMANLDAQQQSDRTQGSGSRFGRPDAVGNIPRADPVTGSLAHRIKQSRREGKPFTEDELRMRVRSDLAAMHLAKTLPLDPFVAELSIASGQVLPSQGVIVDADGDVVSQAVGFSDDHYLPFDLRNMRMMRGGQYVRTRMQGGLTGEDIYAAVRSGTRMVTVVSSSGVYSLEFDPNFRGARGMSDKARSMYDRYLKILDAVDSSDMYVQDLDPRVMAKLQQEAREFTGEGPEGANYKQYLNRRRDEERAKTMVLSDEDMEKIKEEAESRVLGEVGAGAMSNSAYQRRVSEVFEELESNAKDERAQKLRLNSEGYRIALETLQQQFPYFIKDVSYEPLVAPGTGGAGFFGDRGQQNVARQRLGAEDRGYVNPGNLRSRNVRSGYYKDPTINTYQNKGGRSVEGIPGVRGAAPSRPGADPANPASPGAPGAPTDPNAPAPAGGQTVQAAAAGPGTAVANVAAFRPMMEAQQQKVFAEISSAWGSIENVKYATDASLQPEWSAVAQGTNQQKVEWLLGGSSANLRAKLSDSTAVEALRDRGAVKAALEKTLNGRDGTGDFFGAGKTFMGQNSFDTAAELLSTKVQELADLEVMKDPFVAEQAGDAMMAHKGLKAQLFSDIASIKNDAQFNKVMQDPSNARVRQLAVTLGADPQGGAYRSMVEVSGEVNRRLKDLDTLEKVLEHRRANPADHAAMAIVSGGFMEPDAMVSFPPRMAAATGLPEASINQLLASPGGWGKSQAEQSKRDLQRAWSMVTMARVLEVQTGVSGGQVDVTGPKDPRQRVLKSQRRVRVVSSVDPLAVEVARRRAMRLPVR